MPAPPAHAAPHAATWVPVPVAVRESVRPGRPFVATRAARAADSRVSRDSPAHRPIWHKREPPPRQHHNTDFTSSAAAEHTLHNHKVFVGGPISLHRRPANLYCLRPGLSPLSSARSAPRAPRRSARRVPAIYEYRLSRRGAAVPSGFRVSVLPMSHRVLTCNVLQWCLQTAPPVGVAHCTPSPRPSTPATGSRNKRDGVSRVALAWRAQTETDQTRMRRTAHVHARADGSHTQRGEPTAHTYYQQDAQSQASTGSRVHGMRSQLRLAPVSHLSTSNPIEHPKEPSSVERITMLCGGARPCTPALPLMRRVPHTATHAPLLPPPPLCLATSPGSVPGGGCGRLGGGPLSACSSRLMHPSLAARGLVGMAGTAEWRPNALPPAPCPRLALPLPGLAPPANGAGLSSRLATATSVILPPPPRGRSPSRVLAGVQTRACDAPTLPVTSCQPPHRGPPWVARVRVAVRWHAHSQRVPLRWRPREGPCDATACGS